MMEHTFGAMMSVTWANQGIKNLPASSVSHTHVYHIMGYTRNLQSRNWTHPLPFSLPFPRGLLLLQKHLWEAHFSSQTDHLEGWLFLWVITFCEAILPSSERTVRPIFRITTYTCWNIFLRSCIFWVLALREALSTLITGFNGIVKA